MSTLKKVKCSNCIHNKTDDWAWCGSKKARQDVSIIEEIDWRLVQILKSDMNSDGFCFYYRKPWWKVWVR